MAPARSHNPQDVFQDEPSQRQERIDEVSRHLHSFMAQARKTSEAESLQAKQRPATCKRRSSTSVSVGEARTRWPGRQPWTRGYWKVS